MNSLKKTLVLSLGLGGDMIEYCTSGKEDRLGKMLGEDVAWLEVAVLCKRVEHEERECK